MLKFILNSKQFCISFLRQRLHETGVKEINFSICHYFQTIKYDFSLIIYSKPPFTCLKIIQLESELREAKKSNSQTLKEKLIPVAYPGKKHRHNITITYIYSKIFFTQTYVYFTF